MTDFHRTALNEDTFIRGAARFLWAGATVSFPSEVTDIIDTTIYNAQTGWNDLGATKNGVTITVNSTDESFDVDQIYGELDSRPTGWTCEIATALSEMSLKHLAFAWEGSTPQVDSGVQTSMGVGNPLTYTRRRLAVLHQRDNGNIRAYIFRKVQRQSVASAISHAKTGEQQTVPVAFRALADTSIADQLLRYFMILDTDTTNQV